MTSCEEQLSIVPQVSCYHHLCLLVDLEFAEDVAVVVSSSAKLQHVVNLVPKLAAPHRLRLCPDKRNQRFGRLPNLDPYGRELSLVQYYFIDIFAVIIGLAAGFLVILILLIKRFCCKRERKSKSE
ncbi:hypothetical protein RB195_006791 [Necator americanus]|uniref:Uncharacterized protein n=1 Tax=Necator americanus TaxID=51031 RepID=A0ABR1BX26_NECAM